MMRNVLTIPTAFVSVVAALGLPAGADAAGRPVPANEPGIAQYTETLPSAGGGQPAGSNTSSRKLSPKLRAQLKREGGRAASALQAIVSSAAYGAPQTKLRSVASRTSTTAVKSTPGAKSRAVQIQAASGQQSGAAAAANAADRGYVLALVIVLVALATAAAAVVMIRRRRRPA